MTYTETALPGVFIIEPEKVEDSRGFFARTWCSREFQARGLNPGLVQVSISYNRLKGTLRGMHYQAPPRAEAKVVRCTRGAIYDVALDVRPGSPTFRRWVAVELTADNRRMLYVPEGCAHGFQTLTEDAEVLYQISEYYAPELARGLRWDDPAFAIAWPLPVASISARDAGYQDFDEVHHA